MQQKTKWRINQEGLKEGDLVVIKESNVPPLKWRMARITKLYPGPDGIARVADLHTIRGIVRRAVHNLCSLPDPTSEVMPRNPEDSTGGKMLST